MDYTLMIAPFDFGNHNRIAAQQFFDNYAFWGLTSKQAKEYFEWFKSEIPNRIVLLWERVEQDLPEVQPFDYSLESLISLREKSFQPPKAFVIQEQLRQTFSKEKCRNP